jgi:phage shock protein PspC (stress-responsive transcriptional regulator)
MNRLYRSRRDRMLAGVAGGLAEMWDADPSLVRVIWALLVLFTGGIALIVYIVMAIVIPEDDAVRSAGAGQTFGATPPPAANASWTPAEAQAADDAAREARAARRAARGDRGFPAGAILGGFLIILGGFFLAREFLPQIDFDWFWPLILVGLGVLLVVSAVRRPNAPG